MAALIEAAPGRETGKGAGRVLTMSTIAFTLLFAVWWFCAAAAFAYTKDWSGFPTSTFFVVFILTALCAVWMFVTIVRMLDVKSPELAGNIEPPVNSHGTAL